MKRPLEQDYTSLAAYTRALEEYCDALAQPEQEPVAHCEAGPNYCWKCLEEAKPTYGSEEIRKLREVIANQAKIIEEHFSDIRNMFDQEPDIYPEEAYEMGLEAIAYYAKPQRTWVGLMRGVRVEGDTVVITVKGGNDAARQLCGKLINEMEMNI